MRSKLQFVKGMRKRAPKNEKIRESYYDRIFEANKEEIVDAYNRESDRAEATRKSEAKIKEYFKEQLANFVDQGYNLKEATEAVGKQKRYFDSMDEMFKYRYTEELRSDDIKDRLRQIAKGRFVAFDVENVEFVSHDEKQTVYKGQIKYGQTVQDIMFKRQNSPDEATGSYWEVIPA